MWQKLIDTILKLTKIYNTLFSLNEEKHKIVLAVDIKALDALIEKEQNLTKKIMQAEQSRQKVLRSMAAANPSISELANAKTLLTFCPEEYRENFMKANQALSNAVKKVSELTDANRLLLQGALTAVNMNINSLSGIEADPGYGKSGKQNFSIQKKKFDFEA